MKKISLAVLSLALVSCWNSSFAKADQQGDPVEVEIPVKALLMPYTGYEEKNTIQAVMFGVLPNSCYTLGHYQTEQNDLSHTIKVRQFAVKQTSGPCAEEATMGEHLKMLVPFTNEIYVGNLPAGDYQFVFNQAGGRQAVRMMNVAPNKTWTVDTLPYALVSNVSAPDVLNGKDELQVVVTGILNSSCTQLNEKVQIENQEDVSVLMPTVSVKPGVVCAQALIPFEKRVNLGKATPGIHLIQSRSMNGRAVNKVVQVSR